MRNLDRELARAPHDLDVRAWRARVLAWSGHLAEAEKEYLEILQSAGNDPDHWMGLASVYLREGRAEDALPALDRAVELDPCGCARSSAWAECANPVRFLICSVGSRILIAWCASVRRRHW
jgi:Tfp pilus assembly protein PilF